MEIAYLRDVFFSVSQTPESPLGPSLGCAVGGLGSRNGFGSRTSASAARAWKMSSYVVTGA
jgi:hypothetical protein